MLCYVCKELGVPALHHLLRHALLLSSLSQTLCHLWLELGVHT
jgi:hypothetical protein